MVDRGGTTQVSLRIGKCTRVALGFGAVLCQPHVARPCWNPGSDPGLRMKLDWLCIGQ